MAPCDPQHDVSKPGYYRGGMLMLLLFARRKIGVSYAASDIVATF